MKKIFIISILLSSCFAINAQQDTTILKQDQLTTADIIPLNLETTGQRIISTFNQTKSIQNSPYTTYIVTKEEIRDNGYVTLTDVLSLVPGIFVSPLGSASEGEMFMMRGLKGNRYAKILINGVSVKPLMTAGMPIGANLPIRQAERVEIIQGTSSSEFGFGANAGIINIVLKDSERPIYTQADLSIGDFGYTNVDVMFGGKIGRGKNIIRFSAWGSSTLSNDWRIPFPDTDEAELLEVFGNSNYNNLYYNFQNPSYLSTANYRGTAQLANRNAFQHQSRQFGIRFQYKKLDFGIDYHNRRDHSALGLNPLALAYHNSNSFKGEQFPRLTFARKPGTKKINWRQETSFLLYYLDGRSSKQPIQSYYGYGLEQRQILNLINQGITITPEIIDTVRSFVYNAKMDDERYDFGFHYQLSTKQLFTAKIWKKHSLMFGLDFNVALGVPELNYLKNPIGENFTLLEPQSVNPDGSGQTGTFFGQSSVFLQADFNWDKFYFSIGSKALSINLSQVDFSPRASFNYRPSPKLTFRGSAGIDYWMPSPYFQGQTYAFNENLQNNNFALHSYTPERTISLEAGVRWQLEKKYYFDLTYFVTNTDNLLSFNYIRNYEGIPAVTANLNAVGYFNFPDSYKRLTGFQGQIEILEPLTIKGLKFKVGGLVHFGAYNLTGESEDRLLEIENFPNLLVQGSLSYHLSRRWYFNFESILHTYVPSSYVHREFPGPGGLISNVVVRYKFSENFGIYAKGLNIFNTVTAGISANRTPDALIYNPQPLIRFRMGVNYRLE